MARSGGTEIPVEGALHRITNGIRYVFTGKGAAWFGPGTPMAPSAPAQVAGRQFELPINYNALLRVKETGIGFRQLRVLADSCDIIRLLVEIRKDQLCSLSWSVQKEGTLDPRRGAPRDIQRDAVSEAIRAFLVSPDRMHGWEEWLRLLLEDMFVIDAATLYVQRTKGGDVYALHPVDGATIKRLIDPHGWTPTPPLPAFQQILHGTAAVNYTSDELIYRPRNPRPNRLYGLGHVEQIIVMARTWLARQASNLEYYDEGSVPDGFLSASKDWGAQQIAEYQALFDLQLAGQLGERRKVKITPSDSKFTETKTPALKDKYDEWLARIACFCFSIPPTAFVDQMNRATAGTVNISSLETGLGPAKMWVERLMTNIIERYLGHPGYEFTFRDKEAQDPLERAQIDQIYVQAGVLLADEVRGDLGLLPLPRPAEPASTSHGDTNHAAAPSQTIQAKRGDGVAPVRKSSEPLTKHEKLLASAFDAAFDLMRKQIAERAESIGKAAGDDSQDGGQWAAFAGSFDTSPLSLVYDDLEKTLTAVAQNGARAQIMKLVTESEVTPQVVREATQQAVSATEPGASAAPDIMVYEEPDALVWAREHAAELITKDGQGGELADATRNMLRRTVADAIKNAKTEREIADQLQHDYAFSRTRSELIARTEVRNAQGAGNHAGALRVGMKVKKWLLSNDDNACPICVGNAEQGYVPINQPFSGGVEAPLQHPRCRCVAVYKRAAPN